MNIDNGSFLYTTAFKKEKHKEGEIPAPASTDLSEASMRHLAMEVAHFHLLLDRLCQVSFSRH